MPVKRRFAKRRLNEEEAVLRADLFETGFDFFGDLKELGFQTQAAARAAAPEAWARLGAAFMAKWTPTEAIQQPWALEQFGRPACQ